MRPARVAEKGQVMILGLFILLVFLGLAMAMVDGFALLEARNWGYQAAQQAALAGASAGRDWAGASDGCIALDPDRAAAVAEEILESELALRGMAGFTYEVRVLPGAGGGSLAGFPPQAVRLDASGGDWSIDEPGVGVYLSFPLQTFLLSFVGRATVPIQVFASASVAQPAGACR